MSIGTSAFPVTNTLRDYFAAAALQGILAKPMANGPGVAARTYLDTAAHAYAIADAMLEVRDKK